VGSNLNDNLGSSLNNIQHNNLSKMNKSVIEVWSSILKSTPKSRLVLKSKQLADPGIYQKTQHQFETHGVDAGRLILMSDAMSYEDHLRQYEKMDIALDTFPYPGVTTSAEAICMGVPVLTMRGHRFLSSTATSIAVNAGLPDWVASGSEDYIQKAIHFASDANKLAFLRRSLIDRSPSSPLFDTPRFAKSFGDALWGMWRQGSKNVSLV